MNDLVSEYQQYQDATAEGTRRGDRRSFSALLISSLSLLQKKAKVVKKKANKKVPRSFTPTRDNVAFFLSLSLSIFYSNIHGISLVLFSNL